MFDKPLAIESDGPNVNKTVKNNINANILALPDARN